MVDDHRKNSTELIQGFEEVCRSKGLRLTHQRTEIFRELAQSSGHPTAEYVFNRVRRRLKTISLDTVYRTIATFEECGLIKRIQVVGDAARFDVNLSVHHHLVCSRCEKIEDFYWPDFDRLKLPDSARQWAEIDSRHVELRGLCQRCQADLERQ